MDRLRCVALKLGEVAGALVAARTEAEYAAFRSAQALRDAVSRLEGDLGATKDALAQVPSPPCRVRCFDFIG